MRRKIGSSGIEENQSMTSIKMKIINLNRIARGIAYSFPPRILQRAQTRAAPAAHQTRTRQVARRACDASTLAQRAAKLIIDAARQLGNARHIKQRSP